MCFLLSLCPHFPFIFHIGLLFSFFPFFSSLSHLPFSLRFSINLFLYFLCFAFILASLFVNLSHWSFSIDPSFLPFLFLYSFLSFSLPCPLLFNSVIYIFPILLSFLLYFLLLLSFHPSFAFFPLLLIYLCPFIYYSFVPIFI